MFQPNTPSGYFNGSGNYVTGQRPGGAAAQMPSQSALFAAQSMRQQKADQNLLDQVATSQSRSTSDSDGSNAAEFREARSEHQQKERKRRLFSQYEDQGLQGLVRAIFEGKI